MRIISSCKNAIPYSQLVQLRRLRLDNSHFSVKAHEVPDFFHDRDYPDYIQQEATSKV